MLTHGISGSHSTPVLSFRGLQFKRTAVCLAWNVIKKRLLQARELAEADGVDPLDAFMAAEILPEVKQKEQEEAAKKEEERMKLAKQLAV